MEKIKSVYAIPCMYPSSRDDFDLDDVFFLTFKSTDENEVLKLASCVCGPYMASKSLVIINDRGQVTLI